MAIKKTTEFLTWANAQAKQHGANSEISNVSKLASKYIIGDYATWGDVVKAAEADLRDQGRKPDAPVRLKPKTAKDWKLQITQLATIAEHQQNANDRLDTTSQEYKDGVARLKETRTTLATAQTEYSKVSEQEKTTATATKTAKDVASQVTQVKSDLADLQDQRRRAADIGDDTTQLDKQISDAQKKLDKLVIPASTTPAGKSGSLFFPTSGTGTVAKPAVTPPKTVKSPSASAGTPGNGTIPTGATWDGKKWVAPPKTPALTQADFLAKYGTTLAFINSDPSLTKLFNDASKPGAEWSAARFTLELGNTAWANRLSASAQAEELIRLKTPSTYASSYNNMREHIASLAVSMGESLTAADIGPEIKPTGPNGTFTAADVARTEGTVTQWALDHSNDPSFANGEALQKFIATKGAINLSLPGGQAAKDNMDLKAYAGQMGMGAYALPPSGDPSKMGSDYFSGAAQSILLGKSTIDTWKSDLLQKAKDTYKAFAPSLDAGQTVQSLAAPYINTLANLLEIPTGQVDLSSTSGYGKMVHDAMIGSDPANQKPMALYDFEKLVKSQPGWGSTNNARDTIMGGVGSLLKSLGKVS